VERAGASRSVCAHAYPMCFHSTVERTEKMSGKREMPVAVNPHRASGTSTSWPFCILAQLGARSGRKRMSCLLRSSPRSRTYRTGSSRRGEVQRGMFELACCFRGGGERKAAEPLGEHLVVTESGVRLGPRSRSPATCSPAGGCGPPQP
jgi:hypothetical protein